jgi:hypothetical protein
MTSLINADTNGDGQLTWGIDIGVRNDVVLQKPQCISSTTQRGQARAGDIDYFEQCTRG